MMTKALQKQLKAIFNHEILTTAKELELQMSTKLAESCKSKEPCKGLTTTSLAASLIPFLRLVWQTLNASTASTSLLDSLTGSWDFFPLTSLPSVSFFLLLC